MNDPRIPQTGWYPDPTDPEGTLRLWDGNAWTDKTSPRPKKADDRVALRGLGRAGTATLAKPAAAAGPLGLGAAPRNSDLQDGPGEPGDLYPPQSGRRARKGRKKNRRGVILAASVVVFVLIAGGAVATLAPTLLSR